MPAKTSYRPENALVCARTNSGQLGVETTGIAKKQTGGIVKNSLNCFGTAVALTLVLMAGQACAQATRTWVSGVGDDVNPCSRTAPCKTFAGAISKTAAGGEIDVLDPAGFGAVTIAKSITINGTPFQAGVLVAGTNGIIVSAAATDTVILRGLDLVGLGTGLAGVTILQAKSVLLENVRISDFVSAAVSATPSTALNLTMEDVTVTHCANPAAPPPAVAPAIALKPSAGLTRATLSRVRVSNCGAGIDAKPTGTGTVDMLADDSSFAFGVIGVSADGAGVTVRLSNSNVFGNTTGLATANGGGIVSYNNNRLRGNTADGSPTTTVYQR